MTSAIAFVKTETLRFKTPCYGRALLQALAVGAMFLSFRPLAFAIALPITVPFAALTLLSNPARAATFDLVETSIPEIQSAINDGLISSEYVVQQYLNRIAAYDDQGPTINSIIELNPNALETARSLDANRSTSVPLNSLYGIPVLLKDNIDTFDLPTTAGALALKDSIPPDDAFITQQLREAGAIILGKANLTEFANFVAFDMPNGFSAVGGQTLNPYDPGVFDVGGSSSGPAAAVAANLALVSIGTETSGSILSPASSNSLVGIKPTVGLISRDGIIPISATQDTAGPITRTVEDAAILLGALTGVDPDDPVTAESAGRSFEDYTSFLNVDGLEGKRLGILRDPFFSDFLSEGEQGLAEQAFDDLERLGAELVDSVEFPNLEALFEVGFDVLLYEFNVGLEDYLASLGEGAPVTTLADVVAFNEANPEEAVPFGQEILELSLETEGDLNDPAYLAELETGIRLTTTEGVDVLLESLDLDALLFPNNLAAIAGARPGYPSITVPAGYTSEGEPFGLTFLSDAFSEPELIELAYSYEQGTLRRVAPDSTPGITGDRVTVPEPSSPITLIIISLCTLSAGCLARSCRDNIHHL